MKKSIKKQLDYYLEEENLESVIETRFSRYAKYIILDRALPDIRDGLKPVQRRILYAMWRLNLKATSSFKKSARVVGDVIGKYHPHGESSVYSAMIRLGQEWKSSILLINIHGNKGSIDGDPPAAMRYTEARLFEIAHYFLEDIEFNTVQFIPNFDDSEIEPTVLPTYLPNFIINGAKGIASGYATNVPPHNLQEVIDATKAMILNPNLSIIDLMKYIKGPDFPTYGTIFGIEDIYKAYSTGVGRIIVRATIKEVREKNKKFLYVTSIPFDTIKSSILKKIEEYIINKKIAGLKSIRDDSDRKGISIVIELDQSVNKIDPIIKFLYKYTDLQKYYNINLVGIADNRPKVLNLQEIISYHISHMEEISRRKAIFLLNKAKKRLEIINGLIKAISILDAIIKTIRKSENKQKAITNLVKQFKFTKVQATAIVNLRLHRLTSTDIFVLKKDESEQKKLISHYNKLLRKKKYLNNYLINILDELSNKFSTKRKTKIVFDIPDSSFNLKDIMRIEEVGIIITKSGYIKRLTIDNYNEHEKDIPIIREGDALVSTFICTSKDTLLLFTSKGNFVSIPIYRLGNSRWQADGEHVNSLSHIDSNENIIGVVVISSFKTVGKTKVIMLTKNGMIKSSYLRDFEVSRINKSNMCMRIKNQDELISIALSTSDVDDFYIVTLKQRGMKIKIREIPTLSLKTSGVKGIKLTNDQVVYSSNINNDITLVFQSLKYMNINPSTFKKKSKGRAPEKLHSKNIKHELVGVCQPKISKYVTFSNLDISSAIYPTSFFFNKAINKEQLSKIKIQLNFNLLKLFPTIMWKPYVFKTITKNNNISLVDEKVSFSGVNLELRKKLSSPISKTNNHFQNTKKIHHNLKTKIQKTLKSANDSTLGSFKKTSKVIDLQKSKEFLNLNKIEKKINNKQSKTKDVSIKNVTQTLTKDKKVRTFESLKKKTLATKSFTKTIKNKNKHQTKKKGVVKVKNISSEQALNNLTQKSPLVFKKKKTKIIPSSKSKKQKTIFPSITKDNANNTNAITKLKQQKLIYKEKDNIDEDEEDHTLIDFDLKNIIGNGDNEDK